MFLATSGNLDVKNLVDYESVGQGLLLRGQINSESTNISPAIDKLTVNAGDS